MKKLFSGRAVFMTLVLSFLFATSLPGSAQAVSATELAKSYTVTIPGDSLSEIAGRLCNDIHYWRSIAQANKITVAPYWVELNQTIVVPCMKPASAALPSVPAPQPIAPIAVTAASRKPIAQPAKSRTSFVTMVVIGLLGIAFFVAIYIWWIMRRPIPPDPSGLPRVASEPIVLAPCLINPELAALQDAATPEIPGVAFTLKGVLCFAKFEPGIPMSKQSPTVFIYDDAPMVNFLFPCEWEKREVRVREILEKKSSTKDRHYSTYETA